MFTQRNNPYCDLLKISVAKILYFLVIRKFYRIFLLFLQKISNLHNHEKNIGT